MKIIHLIIGSLIIGIGSVSAQQDADAAKKAKEIKEVTFWGVDYSLVRFYGSEEPARRLYNIMKPVNELFVIEAEKYDVSKSFQKQVTVDISVGKEKSLAINIDGLYTSDPGYTISPEQVVQLVQQLQLPENSGTGLIFHRRVDA